MSLELAKAEIERFISSSEPAVICISGKWGVGKTYAWKKYLRNVSVAGNVSPKYNDYAYISLFGQNSLHELKNSIFPNTIDLKYLDQTPGPDNYYEKIKTIKNHWRKSVPAIANLGQKKISIIVPDLPFLLLVKNQIICFDDLERHGKELQLKDVLGLASFLKEEKKCKVIFILNDEILQENDKEDFKEQLEKVVDIFIKFNPTPEEAVEISVDKDFAFYDNFKIDVIKLGIVNIRVIRKIQRLACFLKDKLSSHDARIFDNALHSLILLGWAFYQPTEAPSIEFIKEYTRYYSLLGEKDKEKDEDKLRWANLLNTFGWAHFDELDLLIWNSIQNGYFDEPALHTAALRLQVELSNNDKDNSFSKAWELYHGSFADNEKEVLNGIYESFNQNVKTISPSNLDATIRFFKEFGRLGQAKEMIETYIARHPGNRDFYNMAGYAFREDVKDEDVIFAFDEKSATYKDDRDPLIVLENIVKNSGWNLGDIELLSKLTKEDFYKIFKENKGDKLKSAIYGALKFNNIRDISKKEKSISLNAIEALKQIGSESDINKRRVASYGIKMD